VICAIASFQPKRRTSDVQGVDTITKERYIRNSFARDATHPKKEAESFQESLKKVGC
jgi:hypothetical protein